MQTHKPTQPEMDYQALEAQAKATLESWMAIQRPVFSMMTEINGRLIDQAFRVNQAWFNMMGRCIDQEIAATRRMMSCRNVKEVVTAYRDVVDAAQREARAEAAELTRLNQQVAGETLAAFRDGLEEAAQELRH
jgi:hypothetical protein